MLIFRPQRNLGSPSNSPKRNEPDVVLDSYVFLGSDLEINQQNQKFLDLPTFRKAPEMLIDADSADNSTSQKNTSWISHWAKSGGPFRISTVDPLHDVARMAAENIDRK